MSRDTIDFGIDLGTTNSTIATLKGVVTEIIKNNADADTTPSVVSIDRRGATQVGQRAKNRIPDAPNDAYGEFKRRIGSKHIYEFKSSGEQRKPEELSAEVLKSLRDDVQQRTGELISGAVITVPAAFELHQCDATSTAAKLCGLDESPLLQEPVAAALAHGFQADKEKAYWLVYDFGGGTFDAAVIKAEEGTIHVVNHGGDNFLGGADIDWAVIEQILVPRLLQEYALPEFSRGNKLWERAFAVLKRSTELAKIELSRCDRTFIDMVRFKDPDGEEIEFECDLTRDEVIQVAEPLIMRSVNICKQVLSDKNLGKEAVEKVILVGGPTKAPYFREMLESGLGIPLDFSVDPLTVVAQGAAVFAGTQRLTQQSAKPPQSDEYTIQLKHRPVGMDSAPMVGGKVAGSKTDDFTGFTLELTNPKTQWRSGKVSLRPDGVFIAHLHTERGERNEFSITLHDPSGRQQKTTPDSLTYTVGAVVEEQPLINSMGIALANNEYDRLFEKGQGLPLRATRDYRTAHAINLGQAGELIRIPIVEGENEKADRNRHIDDLVIDSGSIRRDLPIGSEIEVTLKMDQSRLITATAYVPLLDEEFSRKVQLRHNTADASFLKEDFDAEMQRFDELKSKSSPDDKTEQTIRELERSPLMREVKELLAASEGDPDAAAKCEKRLLELKLNIDDAADVLEWPSLVSEARDWQQHLAKVSEQYADREQSSHVKQLNAETNEILGQQQPERLRKKIDQLVRLYYEIVTRQPAWWVYQYQQAAKEEHKMLDRSRAARLIGQGNDFISRNNAQGLENVVRELWRLLPDEVVEAAQRGYGAGLVR